MDDLTRGRASFERIVAVWRLRASFGPTTRPTIDELLSWGDTEEEALDYLEQFDEAEQAEAHADLVARVAFVDSLLAVADGH